MEKELKVRDCREPLAKCIQSYVGECIYYVPTTASYVPEDQCEYAQRATFVDTYCNRIETK